MIRYVGGWYVVGVDIMIIDDFPLQNRTKNMREIRTMGNKMD